MLPEAPAHLLRRGRRGRRARAREGAQGDARGPGARGRGAGRGRRRRRCWRGRAGPPLCRPRGCGPSRRGGGGPRPARPRPPPRSPGGLGGTAGRLSAGRNHRTEGAPSGVPEVWGLLVPFVVESGEFPPTREAGTERAPQGRADLHPACPLYCTRVTRAFARRCFSSLTGLWA